MAEQLDTMKEWCLARNIPLYHLENARRKLLRDWQEELERRQRTGKGVGVREAEEQVAYYRQKLGMKQEG